MVSSDVVPDMTSPDPQVVNYVSNKSGNGLAVPSRALGTKTGFAIL
jgi:hypothetical protein